MKTHNELTKTVHVEPHGHFVFTQKQLENLREQVHNGIESIRRRKQAQ